MYIMCCKLNYRSELGDNKYEKKWNVIQGYDFFYLCFVFTLANELECTVKPVYKGHSRILCKKIFAQNKAKNKRKSFNLMIMVARKSSMNNHDKSFLAVENKDCY